MCTPVSAAGDGWPARVHQASAQGRSTTAGKCKEGAPCNKGGARAGKEEDILGGRGLGGGRGRRPDIWAMGVNMQPYGCGYALRLSPVHEWLRLSPTHIKLVPRLAVRRTRGNAPPRPLTRELPHTCGILFPPQPD